MSRLVRAATTARRPPCRVEQQGIRRTIIMPVVTAVRKALRTITAATLLSAACSAFGQAPGAPVSVAVPGDIVVRRIEMKDSLAADELKQRLDSLKTSGLFRVQIPGDPKKPELSEISFLTSGNFLLVIGDKNWVDSEIGTIGLIAFMSGRPRSHLDLNLRVVQISGPANNDVIQMTDAVQALVASQRAEVVRAFSDLQSYLLQRLRERQAQKDGQGAQLYGEVRRLLPTLGDGSRPLTVPEILLLLLIDRALPAPSSQSAADRAAADAQSALNDLPSKLADMLQDPNLADRDMAARTQTALAAWQQAITAAATWCDSYATTLDKENGVGVSALRDALQRPGCPLPSWVALRMSRSITLTQQLYPDLVTKQTQESLRELARRFRDAASRAATIETALAESAAAAPLPATSKAGAGKTAAAKVPAGDIEREILALKAVADELVPAPQELFQAVTSTVGEGAPNVRQLIDMFSEYGSARAQMDAMLSAGDQEKAKGIDFARMEADEAGLNLWMRRASEAMSRALEQRFYNHYVEQLRLLANRRLGKTSARDILSGVSIEDVPDVARDVLLADTGVNVFVSNSVNMQFAPDTTNSVTADVQASLPEKISLADRISRAASATDSLQKLQKDYGLDGRQLLDALLAGGQAVPVQSGVDLSVKPTIALDDSTVTLTLTAHQSLQPDSDKIADRVTKHNIDNATVTVLCYEPTVISTLTSNVSYYENVGGVPLLREIPGVKNILNDIGPLKVGKRQKGVYQSSVIILEPTVIPTIEDLVRFYSGWRSQPAAPVITVGK